MNRQRQEGFSALARDIVKVLSSAAELRAWRELEMLR